MSHLPGERPGAEPTTPEPDSRHGRIRGITVLAAGSIGAIALAATLVTVANPNLTGPADQERGAPSSSATPARLHSGIGDGTHSVGEEIAAGTYRAVVPSDAVWCYWARLNDPDGDYDDILANGNAEAGHRVTVTVEASDTAFTSNDCGDWIRLS